MLTLSGRYRYENIAFSPDDVLATADGRTVRLWNIADPRDDAFGEQVGSFDAAHPVAWSPDGSIILADRNIYDPKDGSVLGDLGIQSWDFDRAVISPDNRTVAVIDGKQVRWWTVDAP